MFEKKNIWEVVKEMESKTQKKDVELGEARATMIVNYGTEGKCIKGLCHETDTLVQMIMKVLDHYDDKSNIKYLGIPITIGELKKLIKNYGDDVSFGFRNQPLQALYELNLEEDGGIAVVFQ